MSIRACHPMKNDIAKPHPGQRLPGGKPRPIGTVNNRCRQCQASVSPRLPVQTTDKEQKAGKETADGERFSDFDQESIL
jgi:hypothetical protein